MNYFTLLLPIVLIIGLFVGVALLKRRLFDEDETPPPIPIPDAMVSKTGAPEFMPYTQSNHGGGPEGSEPTLSPARLYARPPLDAPQMSVFGHLLRALPGYVVLPKITYDHFLEARDGSPSENTSLQNRAARQLADFVICDKKLRVLLVCQIKDGTHLPARMQERQKMLDKTGLRMLRWQIEQPPDPSKLLKTVQTLEKLGSERSVSSRRINSD